MKKSKVQERLENGTGSDRLPDLATDTVKVKVSKGKPENVKITPLEIGILRFKLIGTAPYSQARFSEKAAHAMREKQESGQRATKGKARAARDFNLDFEQAQHRFPDGGYGIPAGAFRNALISACRLVGFHMTIAKLTLFVQADGYDKVDGTPLVRITKGEPTMWVAPVSNATGVLDLRARPKWEPGWEAILTVSYDRHQFDASDVVSLLNRVGLQVGIGEGRNDSKRSCGMGMGAFKFEELQPEADEGK
jgi:hypothetical protein